MKIKHGAGTTIGPGISITFTGEELARAINAFVAAQGVHIEGPRTVRVRKELCSSVEIYVDPSGFVIDAEGTEYSGRRFGEPLGPVPAGTCYRCAGLVYHKEGSPGNYDHECVYPNPPSTK